MWVVEGGNRTKQLPIKHLNYPLDRASKKKGWPNTSSEEANVALRTQKPESQCKIFYITQSLIYQKKRGGEDILASTLLQSDASWLQ